MRLRKPDSAMATQLGIFVVALIALMASPLSLSLAAAQGKDGAGQGPAATDVLAQNFLAEHEIGRRFHIDPADLPPPKSGAIVTNRPLTLPYDGQTLQAPPGFTATPF